MSPVRAASRSRNRRPLLSRRTSWRCAHDARRYRCVRSVVPSPVERRKGIRLLHPRMRQRQRGERKNQSCDQHADEDPVTKPDPRHALAREQVGANEPRHADDVSEQWTVIDRNRGISSIPTKTCTESSERMEIKVAPSTARRTRSTAPVVAVSRSFPTVPLANRARRRALMPRSTA